MKYLIFFLVFVVRCYFSSKIFRAARYDKSITLFSPEGELLQVSYANVASKKGAPIICIKAMNNSLVLCCLSQDTRFLLDQRSIDKISRIDDSIWMGFSGLSGDGRSLIKKAMLYTNKFRLLYGSPATVAAVAREIGNLQHSATLTGGQIIFYFFFEILISYYRRTSLRSSCHPYRI